MPFNVLQVASGKVPWSPLHPRAAASSIAASFFGHDSPVHQKAHRTRQQGFETGLKPDLLFADMGCFASTRCFETCQCMQLEYPRTIVSSVGSLHEPHGVARHTALPRFPSRLPNHHQKQALAHTTGCLPLKVALSPNYGLPAFQAVPMWGGKGVLRRARVGIL